MARLILLNGAPGAGKSTLARRYADEHPGTLCLDIDGLRTMVGGWADDYAGTGALVRPAALAMITAYLRESADVVLPQLLARETELAKFERAATEAGAAFVHVLLDVGPDTAAARFAGRDEGPHTIAVRDLVTAEGGPGSVIASYSAALAGVRGALRLDTSGDVDATYASLLALLALPELPELPDG
jgi:predicted kinase